MTLATEASDFGRSYPVFHSSDLWVAGSVSNAQDTGKTSGVSYAVGEVQGEWVSIRVVLSKLTFGNHALK